MKFATNALFFWMIAFLLLLSSPIGRKSNAECQNQTLVSGGCPS